MAHWYSADTHFGDDGIRAFFGRPFASAAAMDAAMTRMHGAMMTGYSNDPDRDFAKMMIPHHQGAIDMARVVQQYGDDPQTKAWAEEIIAAQEREIAELKMIRDDLQATPPA